MHKRGARTSHVGQRPIAGTITIMISEFACDPVPFALRINAYDFVARRRGTLLNVLLPPPYESIGLLAASCILLSKGANTQ